MLLTQALSDYGYTLLEASSGQEALRLVAAARTPIHILLTDVVMPLISIPRPSAPTTTLVTLRDSIRSGRCLSFTASSSAPWLQLPAWDGLLPADLQLTIDPATMPAGRQVAELTVRVMEDGVLGNPGKVTVVVEAAAARPTVWLPRLGR